MSSQCGAAIFTFVIATHTFSLLFLRRQWSDRTSYIVLIISWALLLLQLCIENFILAEPSRAPYYGVSGYWCWITPEYPTERYTTSYLHMFISAALSFILHLLVFFQLRGNITLSAGYKIGFQRRPKVRFGRTSNGTYIVTDDRRVESHLTSVAKHMLWYPFAYTLLVLPIAASRYSAFSGASVPFPVTIITAAVFILHGFVNTVLFCTTRNILPGSWRQRLGLGTTRDSGGGDFGLSSRATVTWKFTGFSTARIGSVSKGISSVVISNVNVEKTVEVRYDEDRPSPSCLTVGSPSLPPSPPSPTTMPQAYSSGGQLVDTHRDHTRHLSFLTPRDARPNIRPKVDEDDGDSDFSAGVDPELKSKTVEPEVRPRPSGHAWSGQESGFYRTTSSLQAPASIHLFSTTQPISNADKYQSHSLSTPASLPTANVGRFSGESREF